MSYKVIEDATPSSGIKGGAEMSLPSGLQLGRRRL